MRRIAATSSASSRQAGRGYRLGWCCAVVALAWSVACAQDGSPSAGSPSASGSAFRESALGLAQSPMRQAVAPWIAGTVVEIESTTLLDDMADGEAPGARAWSGWLSNGVRAHAVPMPNDSGKAALRLVLAADAFEGTERNRQHQWMMAQASAAMIDELALSEGEIGAMLKASGWKVSAIAQGGSVTIRAQGPSEPRAVEQVVRAIALMLDRPAWSAAGLTRWRERTRAEITAGQTDPRAALNLEINRMIGTPEWDEQAIDNPKLFGVAQIEAWLVERAVRAPMTIAIAGPIQRGPAMDQLGRWIGGLGSGGEAGGRQLQRARIIPRMPKPWALDGVGKRAGRGGGGRVIEVRAAPGERAMVLRGIAGPPSDQIETARRLRHAMGLLKAHALELLEAQQINVEWLNTGMIFGDREGGRSLLWVVAEVEPELAEQVRETLDQAVVSLGHTAIPEEVVASFSLRIDRQLAQLTKTPSYWVDRLTASDVSGLPVLSARSLREAYAAITADEIASVMRSYSSKAHRLALTAVPIAGPPKPIQELRVDP